MKRKGKKKKPNLKHKPVMSYLIKARVSLHTHNQTPLITHRKLDIKKKAKEFHNSRPN